MRGSISLHPKHGVNPSLGVCFICGQDTNEILLLGMNRGKEAPHKMISGTPCDECKKVLDQGGVFLVEVKDGEEGKKNPYRTGFVLGVRRDALDPTVIGHSSMAWVTESDMRQMLGSRYEEIKNQGVKNAEADKQEG